MAFFYLFIALVFGIIKSGFSELTVNVNPPSVLMVKGSSVKIDCIANGTTKSIVVTWTFNGFPIENTEERRVLSNNTLIIKTLRHGFKGRYVCEAKIDSTQSKSAVVKVDIAVIRKIPKMDDVIAFAGNDVMITCPESSKPSNPQPVYEWYHAGSIGVKLPEPRYRKVGNVLMITGVRLEDTNNYTCVIRNVAGERSQNVLLQVYVPGPLQVTPKLIEKLEGQKASFKCVSTAKPPFPSQRFKWINNNNVNVVNDSRISVNLDGSLSFKQILASDNGTYSCSVTMTSSSMRRLDFKASADLKVQRYLKFDPTKFRSSQSFNRKSNKTHSIKCAVVGDGFIRIEWYKVGLVTLPSRMMKSGNSLIINNLGFKDEGQYLCMVYGKYNNINRTISVHVFEGAEFTQKPKNITVVVGGTGKTVCDGVGRPKPKITWAKAELASNLPKNFKVFKNTTLIVTDAVASNAGTYFCMIANGPTSRNVEFEVIVRKSDGEDSGDKSSPTMGRTVGIAVGCAGAYILLVIGLMIYCRGRRARMLKRQGNVATEIEDGEFNKDLLQNGDEECPLNGDLRNLEQWHFPREDLKEDSTLGHGKYGKVYIARARGINEGEIEVLVAVKQLAAENEAARQAFDQELEMLAQLKHPNVIKLLGICIKDFPLLMITEYSEHGDLKQFLAKSASDGKALNIADKTNVCFEIAQAMDYLSVNGIIHNDLACRNCLVTSRDCHVKIAFFSLSDDTYQDDYCLYNGAHVPLRWLSPEALLEESYSEKSGVWAFGVVVWEVFSDGQQPYPGKGNEEIIKSIKKKNQLEAIDEMPNQLTKMMKNCFRRNPAERPKFADIVTTFEEMPSDSKV